MSQQQPLSRRLIDVSDVGDVAVVTFRKKKLLDEQTIITLKEELNSLVGEDHRRKVLLNFRGVELVSSAMLGSLITFLQLLQDLEGRVVFCVLDPAIYEVFEIAGLARIIAIRGNERSALRSFSTTCEDEQGTLESF